VTDHLTQEAEALAQEAEALTDEVVRLRVEVARLQALTAATRREPARARKAPTLTSLDLEQLFASSLHAMGMYADDSAAIAASLVRDLRATPQAALVREALGDDPECFVVRVVGAHGGDQHRLHEASFALAGGVPRG
jgi:hypothetical protein